LAKGQIFKYEYFRYYDEYFIKDGQAYIIRSDDGHRRVLPVDVFMGVDLAIAEKETADFFVPMIVGRDVENNFYVLSYEKERMSFNKQFDTIVRMADKFPMVQRIGIETNAYQASLAQELKRTTTLPIIDLKTVKDKVTRAMRRSAIFENGKVFIREDMGDFVECLVLFPDVEHDDLFDAFDFAITTTEQKKVRVLDRDAFTI
jgi:predicted phage terminase large subunit-like protein